jgi:predicted ATP-dependent endonuclease of OLD family
MFIKQLQIKNFKCFQDKTFGNLAVPNGEKGSGLNILIGENGNGKTTLLEAINYLILNSFSVQNKLNISDFQDFKQPIEVIADTDEYECSSSIEYYSKWHFKSSGIEFLVKSREAKKRNKILSSPFEDHSWFKITGQYIGGKGAKDVDSRDKPFSNSRIKNDGLNIFYFDKNRNRQITTGNYKTTFEKILDDLSWKFRKNLDEIKQKELVDNIDGEYFKTVQSVIGSSAGTKTASDLKEFFNNDDYQNLKIDLLPLLQPFENAFFTIRKKDELKQILVKDLGSGIEIILTILLLKNIAEASNGKIIYLIDEPELHLHPKAQEKLLELLLEEARDKQVFISTHSPYMFKGTVGEGAKLSVFKRVSEDIEIIDARDGSWGVFGRFSPTWGEINWHAYDLPTVEFHNELYGFLQAKATDEDEQNYYEENFDTWLKGKLNTKQNKIWIKIKPDSSTENTNRTLQTYIRNSIHHPENTKNNKYIDDELRKSTQEMIDFIKK